MEVLMSATGEVQPLKEIPTQPDKKEESETAIICPRAQRCEESWDKALSILARVEDNQQMLNKRLNNLEADVRVVRNATKRHGRWLAEVLEKELAEEAEESTSERMVLDRLPDPK
jgi:hypothetical protein